MPKKYKRAVEHLRAQGKSEDSAHAIATAENVGNVKQVRKREARKKGGDKAKAKRRKKKYQRKHGGFILEASVTLGVIVAVVLWGFWFFGFFLSRVEAEPTAEQGPIVRGLYPPADADTVFTWCVSQDGVAKIICVDRLLEHTSCRLTDGRWVVFMPRPPIPCQEVAL